MSAYVTTALHREYPHLSFKKHWTFTEKLCTLSGQCEALVTAIRNTPIMPQHFDELLHLALLKGAQATTAIEGNTLTDDDIEKLIEGQKLPPSKEYQEIEVKNILDAFNLIFRSILLDNLDDLITPKLLKHLHTLVGKDLGEHFAAVPGQFRNSDVVVGRYRCPDYRDVPVLVDAFCNWLKDEFGYQHGQQCFSDIIIQAIVAHIYIEWIHPFGDGNGRTGRLVEFYILVRGGAPNIASHILSNHYNLTRSEYYRQIEKACNQNDLTDFIEYALVGYRDGLKQTLEVIQKSQFLNSWHKLIYDKFDNVKMVKKDVFKRRRTLALELPIVGSFALSAIPELSIKLAKYYSNVSERTLMRDIEELLQLDLVVKDGQQYSMNTKLLNPFIASQRKGRECKMKY